MDDDPRLETRIAPSRGTHRPLAGERMTMSHHMKTALRDFARTGRAGKEILSDFIREGLAMIDEYGSPHLTTHGANTLKHMNGDNHDS